MTSITFWTRLEPRCRSADMAPGLEARTHDPFWMLARQWQLGEFLADDAGSPIVATVASVDTVLDRYTDAASGGATLPASIPLEAWVEREAVRPAGTSVDYRQSAEAGLYFLRLLRQARIDTYAAAYMTLYAITPPADAERATIDTPALRLADVVARRVLDGVRLAAELRAAQPGLPAAPDISSTDDRDALQHVTNDFLAWYDALFDERAPDTSSTGGAWVNERMEYRFSIDAGATDSPGAFVADRYTGDPLDWTSFDRTATPLGPVAAPALPLTRQFVPAPVTFKGMPARRFWELEAGDVDLGSVEADTTDLGRLMIREFGLVYGNDWYVIPLPVRVGSVCRIFSLVVTDTFGVAQTIPHYAQTADGGGWHMFAISGDATDHRLLMPPVLARALASEPLEQVLLVRDEPASTAWAVERVVQGASGAPVDRASAEPRRPTQAAGGSSLRYRLGTAAPEYFIPFIAVSIDTTQRRMKRAAFLHADGSPGPVGPRGRILAPDVMLFEEEFAREGVRMERVYRLARWTDGSTHLWVARHKQAGATVGSSGLQFDRIEFA